MDSLTDIKAMIKSLIILHGRGLSLKNLEDDYKAHTGDKIPYTRLGFRSLEKFLESLPDTLRLERNSNAVTVHSIFSKKTEHMTQMIRAQKKPSGRNHRQNNKNYGSNFFPAATYRRPYNEERNIVFKSKYPGNIVAPHNSIHIKNVPAPNPLSTESKRSFHNNIYYYYMAENKTKNEEYLIEKATQKTSSTFKQNLKTNDLENIPQSQKINAEIQKQPSEDNIRYLKPNLRTEVQNKPNANENKYSEDNTLSRSFKELSLNKLENKSANESYQIQNPTIPSASIISETKSLNENSMTSTIIPAKAKSSQYYKKLKQYHNNLNIIHEKTSENTSQNNEPAIPHYNHDNEVFRIDYPLPTADICTTIPKTIVPHEFKEGRRIIKLFISEVHNPFRFWFNIATNPDIHPLDLLMAEIEGFYKSLKPDELNMSKSNVRSGQACVALYRNIWHRAEILESASYDQTNDSYVKVFYVDYGTVSECKIKKLKYLLTKFGNLPRQAYRGTLSDIRPFIKWDRYAIQFFLQQVADILLQGKITYLEEDRNICHFRLLRHYNSEEQLVYKVKHRLINELLETEGFAQRSPHYFKSHTEISIREQHYYHEQQRFPSFEVLELGKYPSFQKILYKLQTDGLDLEQKRFWLIQLENLNVPVRYDD